jgi:hypothetical protein
LLSPDEVIKTLESLSAQIERLAAAGAAALQDKPEPSMVPNPLTKSARVDAADWPKMAQLATPPSSPPSSAHGDAATNAESVLGNLSVPPFVETLARRTVIEVPEWIAVLSLIAVRRPHLSGVLRELELVGRGFHPSEADFDKYLEIGPLIKQLCGDIEVQLYSSRLSHLGSRVGTRTRSTGDEARPVHPALPVVYFHSHVTSVRPDDMREIALKILASSGRLEWNTVVDIGRGEEPEHLPGLQRIWPKIQGRIARYMSGCDSAAYSSRGKVKHTGTTSRASDDPTSDTRSPMKLFRKVWPGE